MKLASARDFNHVLNLLQQFHYPLVKTVQKSVVFDKIF